MPTLAARPLLEARIEFPSLVAHHLSRPRLLRRLGENEDRSVALLCAPAGYGKTTLLADYIRRLEVPVACVSIDEGMTSPQMWWRYLLASLDRAVPNFDPPSDELIAQAGHGDVDPMLSWLTVELRGCGEVVVALDDLHRLDDEIVRGHVAPILEFLPASVRFVVAARQLSALPVGRLRLRGELTELRATDLAFSLSEATELLADRLRLRLNATNLRRLWEQTEGWAPGLYLSALGIEPHADHDIGAQFLAEESLLTTEYLLEEAFDTLDDEGISALQELAVLEQCSFGCFGRVFGSVNRPVLERLLHEQLFVELVERTPSRVRMHGLVAKVLRREFARRQPDEVSAIRAKAFTVLLDENRIADALGHATALRRSDLIIALLHEHWIDLLVGSRWTALADALATLDPQLVDRTDVLRYVSLAIEAFSGNGTPALSRLSELDVPSLSAEQRAMLPIITSAAWLQVGDVVKAEETTQEPTLYPLVLETLAGQYSGLVALWTGDLSSAERLFRATLRRVRTAGTGDIALRSMAAGALAVTLVEAHRFDEAFDVATTALVEAGYERCDFDDAAALLHIAVGECCRQLGRTAESIGSLELGVELARSMGPLVHSYGLLSLIQSLSDDAESGRARELVAQARSVLSDCDATGPLIERRWQTATRSLRRRSYSADGLVEAMTEREMTQLRLLPSDLTQRELAAQLGISVNTVKTNNRSIYRKLMVSDRSAAVSAARQHGLLAARSPRP